MEQVHSGLIPHDMSIARAPGDSGTGFRTGNDLNADATLTVDDADEWTIKDGALFFDDSGIDSSSRFLIFESSTSPISNDAYYKISIKVTLGSNATLKIHAPGTDGSNNGKVGDGGADGASNLDGDSVVIDESGTYLFYAKAPSSAANAHVFVAEADTTESGDATGDITIHSVQVYEATPKEMSSSNAISMKSWNGVPKIFSSFNFNLEGDYNWDYLIEGYRIYMKQVDSDSDSLTDEWLLLLDVNLTEGEFVNYSNSSDNMPLHLSADYGTSGNFSNSLVCTNKQGGNKTGLSNYDTMREIPLHTYESENGYKADTVTCAMYKTAAQVGRKMYIGNVKIDGREYPDRMIESPTDRPDTFPDDGLHYIDVSSADGDDIIHLDSIGNILIQFKKKTAYVIEIMDEGVELIDTWYNAGILSPSQVTKAGDGLVWVNNYGLYYYDGDELNRVTSQSFNLDSWIINENKDNPPCVGYDEYSNKVIIVTNNKSTHDNGGYIYDIQSNSITEHQNLFDWYSSSNIMQ